MSEEIKPVPGVEPQAIFAKMQYSQGIAANMFSSCERSRDRKEMIPPTQLSGVNIAKLWKSVFANSSDFFKRYHERRKETDLEISRWEYASDMGSGCRTVSLTTIIDVPRSGTATRVNQAVRFAYTKPDGASVLLVVHLSSQTPSVPAGSSFRTEAVLEIRAPLEEADCTVTIFGGCKKMSFAFAGIQYLAVPRAIREMTKGYKDMLEMISEDLGGLNLRVAIADDEGSNESAPGLGPGGGAADGAQAPGMVFQGLLLSLAVIVTLVLFWSMSTLRGTMRISSTMAERLRDGHDGGWRGSRTSTTRSDETTGGGPHTYTPLTSDQALRHAARDAQIQSLRYRWIEQRAAINSLETSVGWLWWLCTLQFFCILLLGVKCFLNML